MEKPTLSASADSPLPIIGWAFYDFANTLFSILVVTRYLPPLLKELTGTSSAMGASVALSMVLAGLLVPLFGAISDQTGHRKVYLLASTLLCVTSVCLISLTHRIPFILLFFFISNLAYQVSMVFYNSLLTTVSTEKSRGTVSGLGVSLGYAGSLLAITAAHPFVQAFGARNIYWVTGLAYLIFALPLFLTVHETGKSAPSAGDATILRERLRTVLKTVRSLPNHRNMLFFLLGNFFCLDAVNTTIVFYSEYLLHGRAFSAAQVDLCLMVVQISALVGSLLIGRWTDRIGARSMILTVTGAWIAAIGIIVATKGLSFVIFASIIGGIGLGGIWVTGRVLLLDLAPAGKVGEYLGLYGMTGKFSALGALVFGLLADFFSYDRALLFQVVMLGLGFACFRRVRYTRGKREVT